MRGFVVYRTGFEKRRVPCPCWDSSCGTSGPQLIHYTNYSTQGIQ